MYIDTHRELELELELSSQTAGLARRSVRMQTTDVDRHTRWRERRSGNEYPSFTLSYFDWLELNTNKMS